VWEKYFRYRTSAFGAEDEPECDPEDGDGKLIAQCREGLANEVKSVGQEGARLLGAHSKVALSESCWEDADDLRSATYHGLCFSPFALPRAMEIEHRYHQRARMNSIEFNTTWDFKLVAFDGNPGDGVQQRLAKLYPDGLSGDNVKFMHDGEAELHEHEVEFGMEVLCSNGYTDPPEGGQDFWVEVEDIECANVNPTTVRRIRSWLFGSAARSMALLDDYGLLRLVFATAGSAGFNTACGSIGYSWPRSDQRREVAEQLRSEGLGGAAEWVSAGGGLTWLEYQARLAAMALRPQDKYYEPYDLLGAKAEWGRLYLQHQGADEEEEEWEDVDDEDDGDDEEQEEEDEDAPPKIEDVVKDEDEDDDDDDDDDDGKQEPDEMELKAPWLVWDRLEREQQSGGGFGDEFGGGDMSPGMLEAMMAQMMGKEQ
jgi:hypothetical protein